MYKDFKEKGRLSGYISSKTLLKEFQTLARIVEKRSANQMLEKWIEDFVAANRHRLPPPEAVPEAPPAKH